MNCPKCGSLKPRRRVAGTNRWYCRVCGYDGGEKMRGEEKILAEEVAMKYSLGRRKRIIDKKCPQCDGPLFTVNALLMTIEEAKKWLECGLCGEWVLNDKGEK